MSTCRREILNFRMAKGYNTPGKVKELGGIIRQVSKPARYTGGEWNSITKDWKSTPVRVALCYPDAYEIGMSNLAIPILYEILNRQPDVLAERVFAPWTDMEAVLREQAIPLFSLESKHPLGEFDIIGFSLGYELTYTNVLNILDLAQIPLFSHERDSSHPLVIAGGSCALNPEPVADFIDLFVIGEGEEVLIELVEVFRARKGDREKLLRQAAKLTGVYIPRFYQVNYNEDGSLKGIIPTVPEAKPRVERRLVAKLPPPVTRPVVPYTEVIHDYGSIEMQRGCTRGCRFCQAGIIYRPMRHRSEEEIVAAVADLSRYCGYSEVSLLSLNSGDYPGIESLIGRLVNQYYGKELALSLPSLRLDSITPGLAELLLKSQHKLTLTFAPEAGSERLRRAINKNIPQQVILDTLSSLDKEWINLKLYFILGLPGETIDDVEGIVELVSQISRLCRKSRLHVSASVLIPKPHTPCQWLGQESEEQLRPKYERLKRGLDRLRIRFSRPDLNASRIEAALSRGDRRLSKVIHRAWRRGCKFDAWSEHFDYQKWLNAFKEEGLALSFYANRERAPDELLPWEHIDSGVSAEFLKREYLKMMEAEETPDCASGSCNTCGLEQRVASCRDIHRRKPAR